MNPIEAVVRRPAQRGRSSRSERVRSIRDIDNLQATDPIVDTESLRGLGHHRECGKSGSAHEEEAAHQRATHSGGSVVLPAHDPQTQHHLAESLPGERLPDLHPEPDSAHRDGDDDVDDLGHPDHQTQDR